MWKSIRLQERNTTLLGKKIERWANNNNAEELSFSMFPDTENGIMIALIIAKINQ